MENQPIIKPGKFVPPPDFIPQTDFGDIFLEDIEGDNDIELWLMQVPRNANIKQMNTEKITLSGNTQIQPDISSKKTLECISVPYGPRQVNPYCLLLPRQNDKKLSVVKKQFTGHILVSEDIKYPSYDCPPANICDDQGDAQPPPSFSVSTNLKIKVETPAVEDGFEESIPKRLRKQPKSKKSHGAETGATTANMPTIKVEVTDVASLSDQLETCMADMVSVKTEPIDPDENIPSKTASKKTRKKKKQDRNAEQQPQSPVNIKQELFSDDGF